MNVKQPHVLIVREPLFHDHDACLGPARVASNRICRDKTLIDSKLAAGYACCAWLLILGIIAKFSASE